MEARAKELVAQLRKMFDKPRTCGEDALVNDLCDSVEKLLERRVPDAAVGLIFYPETERGVVSKVLFPVGAEHLAAAMKALHATVYEGIDK